MTKNNAPLKGYIKTESTILLIVITLAVGFIMGIVFSAYRSSGQAPQGSTTETTASIQLNSQQMATKAALIKQTEDNPQDAEAWTQLGHFYFDAGQAQNAIDAYNAALKINDNSPDTWTDLGVMYRRNGNPQKAIECFDHALSLDPTHEIAVFNKGIVLMHDMQDTQGALRAWKRLLSINPDAHAPNGLSVKEMVEGMEKNINGKKE